jgi:hypothetical protein
MPSGDFVSFFAGARGFIVRRPARCRGSPPLRYRETGRNLQLDDLRGLVVDFHKTPVPENIVVGVIGRALDRRWNYGVDADDRCHQARVVLFQVFRGLSVEGGCFGRSRAGESARLERNNPIELKLKRIKAGNTLSSLIGSWRKSITRNSAKGVPPAPATRMLLAT